MLDVTSSFVLTIDDKPNRNTGTGRELYSCIHDLSQLPRPTLDTVDGSDKLLYAYTIGFAAILSLCNDRAFGARKLLAPITAFVHTLPTLPHAAAAAVLLLLLYIRHHCCYGVIHCIVYRKVYPASHPYRRHLRF